MDKVVLDAATRAKFAAAGGVVELTDEAGTVVGYYHPPLRGDDPAGGWGPFTAEEVAAAFAPIGPDEVCLTLEEIIAGLPRS